MQRYEPIVGETGNGMRKSKFGRYTTYEGAQAAVDAFDKRVKELEAALENLLGWQTLAPADVVTKARVALEQK